MFSYSKLSLPQPDFYIVASALRHNDEGWGHFQSAGLDGLQRLDGKLGADVSGTQVDYPDVRLRIQNCQPAKVAVMGNDHALLFLRHTENVTIRQPSKPLPGNRQNVASLFMQECDYARMNILISK